MGSRRNFRPNAVGAALLLLFYQLSYRADVRFVLSSVFSPFCVRMLSSSKQKESYLFGDGSIVSNATQKL
uniref:Secreted protein n=1 Tax=Anopheles minimus TaxID=112268 RepID=A0A182VQD0_9DIPT